MKKMLKLATISLVAMNMGLTTVPSTTVTAFAKVRSAKVIKMSTTKKTAYYVNRGAFYSNTKLTKKAHNGAHYLDTMFYATKTARLKKSGKTATYLYLKNSKGNVKGWVARTNLAKVSAKELKSIKQRKSDIKKMWVICRSVTDNQDNTLEEMSEVNTHNTYKQIAVVISYIAAGAGDPANSAAILKTYRLFKGRFDTKTNKKLAKLAAKLEKVYRTQTDQFDNGLIEPLEKAVGGLQK